MRFDSLNIPAFGPFTDFNLEFPTTDSDLHLIYGPNEAGKSSLLRGIHNLLFEIPARSPDNFLHDYNKLVIGAGITHEGKSLRFFRRKGNKNTLTDADSKVIPDSELKSILGPVNEDFFNHMFGLSTGSLRAGAESLLSGNNEIGTLLFSASLGGTRIDKAIEKLEQEANSLAKGGARVNVRIPEAIKRYKEAEKQARDASTSANQWKTLEKDFEKAREEFNQADARLRQLHRRKEQIQAILNALPLISRRDEKSQRLGAIELPELADDFQQRVRESQKNHEQARTLLAPSRETLEKKRGALDELPDHGPTLEAAATIEALHQGIGQHLEDRRELESKQQELESGKAALENQLSQQGYDSVESFARAPQLGSGDLAGLRDLAEQFESALAAERQATENCERLEQDIKSRSSELETLEGAEFTPEQEALHSRASDQRADQKQLAEKREQLERLCLQQEQLGKALAPALESGAIRDLTPPSLAKARQLVDENESLESKRDELEREHRKLEKEIENLDFELKSFQQSHGEIVTKEDLTRARDERDEHWQGIKSKLEKKQDLPSEQLHELDRKIAKPDQIGDRLLDDADATARAAGRREERARKQHHLDQLTHDLSSIGKEIESWSSAWEKLIAFLPGSTLTPAELLPWLDNWEQWQDLDQQVRSTGKQIASFEQEADALLQELREALDAPEKDLPTLSAKLEKAKRKADNTAGQEMIIKQDLAKLRASLEQAEETREAAKAKFEEAQDAWTQAIAAWDFEGSSTQVIAHLEAHQDLTARIDHHQDLEARVEHLQKQCDQFKKRVQNAIAEILPDRGSSPIDEQVSALWSALTKARENNTRAEDLKIEIGDLEEKVRSLQAQSQQADQQLAGLVAMAELGSTEELETAISEHQERLQLRSDLNDISAQLTTMAGSQELVSFVTRCKESDPGELVSEQDQLDPEIETCQSDRDQLHESFLDLKRRKTQLEMASSAASDAQQEAQNALADIVTDTQRFIALHHAIDFLKAQIEAYREQAQGPLISKTSHYFSKLTCDEFSGVAARPADDGRIELVALRASEEEGIPASELATHELSEGTRDQLYLALRLAAIDKHLESHPAMPLILDDVLMTFDDQRTTALLEVLKDLSQKTQVLIFTHHPHNLELAGKATIPHRSHTLPPGNAKPQLGNK